MNNPEPNVDENYGKIILVMIKFLLNSQNKYRRNAI